MRRFATPLSVAVAAPWVLWAAIRVSGVALPYPGAPALAFTPYVALTGFVPIVVALQLRRRAVALVSLAAAVALAATMAPRVIGEPSPRSGGTELIVMSVNVLRGGADPDSVMRIVREQNVDVLSLQESRPAFIARLDRLGARVRFRHRVARPADEALLSALPLAATGRPAEGELRLPGGQRVIVTAVHPRPPISRNAWRAWRDELAALPGTGPGPVRRVLAGDLNATLDHPELRDVINRGYRDAAATTGDGWRTTWPAGRRLPPEITIDHVLADRRIDVASFSVHRVPGSDHRAIVARLVVR